MADTKPTGVAEILLSLQTSEKEKEKLPRRLKPYNCDPTKQVYDYNTESDLDLQLSLGGFYSENEVLQGTELIRSPPVVVLPPLADSGGSSGISGLAAVEGGGNADGSRMKRKMEVLRRDKGKQVVDVVVAEPPPPLQLGSPAWAAGSAAKGPALCNALQTIKSDNVTMNAARGREKLTIGKRRHGSSSPNPFTMGANEKGKSIDPLVMLRHVASGNQVKPVPGFEPELEPKLEFVTENFLRNIRPANDMPEINVEALKAMPIVTTTGNGPYGRRIQGILFKYLTGSICIVCVCHGQFLTPEGFIMHAGGCDVDNAIKRITIVKDAY